MDFKKRTFNNLQGLIALVMVTLPVATSININCMGKAFHCVNSTHFMICVDVGSGLSSTIDNFVIPCPPTTECHPHNRFECEFPPATSPVPTLEPFVSTISAAAIDTTIISSHNSAANTHSSQSVSEIITDNYLNTVSPTTISEEAMNIATEATFTSNVKTLREVNETPAAPQPMIRYDESKFMLHKNKQSSSSTMTPIQETGTGLYDLSSIQPINSVINKTRTKHNTLNTMDKKTSKDILEHPVLNKVNFSKETNTQSTPGMYVTENILNNTLGLLHSNNVTKMTKLIDSRDLENMPLLHRIFLTSTPKFAISQTTEHSDLLTNKTTTNTVTYFVTELPSENSGMDVISETSFATDDSKKNNSDVVPNNIATTVFNSIITSSDVATKHNPSQSSSINEVATAVDATTETIMPSVTEFAFESSAMDANSKTLFTTDVVKQNESKLIIPNNTATTASNIITSFGVTNNKTSTHGVSINENATMSDASTERMVSKVTETVSISSETDVTSKNLITKDVIQKKYSELTQNDIVTTTPSIVTSSDVINSKTTNQSFNRTEIITMTDATTDTVISLITAMASESSGMDVTSETPFATNELKLNYSVMVPNNIATTVSNSIITSSDVVSNNIPLQSLNINEVATAVDVTTETIMSSVTESAFVSSEIDAISKTLFTTDVVKQNDSELIIPNNTATMSSNIITSSDVINNKKPTHGTSINESATMIDASTERMVSKVSETVFISSGADVTSNTLITKDVIQQNYSEITPTNVVTTFPSIVTSSAVINRKTTNPSLNRTEVVTMTEASTDTVMSLITEMASVSSEMDVTSETQFATNDLKQNYSYIIPNNISTTVSNSIITNSDVASSSIPLQISSINEVATVVDATTDTIMSSVTESAFASSGIDAISVTLFTTDVVKQTDSDIIIPNTTVTIEPNIITGFDVTNNKKSTHGASINERATMIDAITEKMVSKVNETVSISSGSDVTSKTVITKDVIQQNYSEITPNNIVPTAPSIVTSSDVINSKTTNQSLNRIEVLTMTDATMNTVISLITEMASVSSGMDVTSETPFATNDLKQNYSDMVPNNISTSVSNNIITSSDVVSSDIPLQTSSINEVATAVDATTETIMSPVTESAFVSSGMDTNSKTLLTTDFVKQNDSELIVPNNTATTASNSITSSDVTNNRKPTYGSIINEVATMINAITEIMVSKVNETVSISSGSDVTSKTVITKNVIQQNYSEITPNNIVTTAPSIVISSDVINSKTTNQSLNRTEVLTTTDATTNTVMSLITEMASVSGGIDVTSETPFATNDLKQNYSVMVPNNIFTTVSNSIITSSDVGSSDIRLQSSSINEVATVVDATTDTIMSSVTESAFASSGIDAISVTIFTTDFVKQTDSDIIIPNTTVTTEPNIITGFDVTNNKKSTHGASINENATMIDAITEKMVSKVNETVSISSGSDVTSKTVITKDVIQQKYSEITPNNIVPTAPSIVTSSDVINSKTTNQSLNRTEVLTMTDATMNTVISLITEMAFVSSGMDVTSETLFATNDLKQNHSDMVPNNISTSVSNNIITSSDVVSSDIPLQTSSINEVATAVDATTETIMSPVTESAFVSSGMNTNSKTLLTTDFVKQNDSELIVPNNTATTASNSITSSDVTNNRKPTYGSIINEVATMINAITEIMVSKVNETVSISSGSDVTSKTVITKDVIQQNYFEITPNNIVTTAPSTVISSDVINSKTTNHSLNRTEVLTMIDATTNTVMSLITEMASVSSGMDVTSETPFATNDLKQNYSNMVPNNIFTTVSNSIITSSDVASSSIPLQSSSINEVATAVDATTETIMFPVTESALVSSGMDTNSKTLLTSDVVKQNDSELIVPNNTATTASNSITSSDVINIKKPTHGASKNESATMVDTSTEIMISKVSETVSVSSGTDVTSKTLITKDVIQQNYSDMVPKNISTTVSNSIITSSDVASSSIPLQTSSINEIATAVDATKEIMVSNITVSEKGYSSTTTSLLISSTEKIVSQTRTHNEPMNPKIENRNTNHKNTQNISVIYTETQSNIRNKNISSNTSHEDQGKSSKFNNMHGNTDTVRKTTFSCQHRSYGKYADNSDCRKFYICIGRELPIIGMCPLDTVFSKFRKQCTRNLSHCIRNNQFYCTSEGRFSDLVQNDIYYICVKEVNKFIRFKLQCQNGYYLNKTSIRCSPIIGAARFASSVSDNSNTNSDQSATKSSSDNSSRPESSVFQCTEEGKFSDPSNCRRYYVCSKSRKFGFKIKKKSCDDEKFFDKDKRKCVDDDSLEC